jgi:polysaccharide biosynthesis transport protein
MNQANTDLSSLPGLGIKPLLSLRRHRRMAWVGFLLVLILGTPLALIKGRSFFVAEAVFQVQPSYMKNLEADKELELQSAWCATTSSKPPWPTSPSRAWTCAPPH